MNKYNYANEVEKKRKRKNTGDKKKINYNISVYYFICFVLHLTSKYSKHPQIGS